LEVDTANMLCQGMEATCTIVQQDWDGMIPALDVGTFDTIMAGRNITPAPLQVIDFSRSCASGPAGFVLPKDGPLAKRPGSGAVFNLTKVDQSFEDIATIREYEATRQHDLDLMAGRIDAAFANAASASVPPCAPASSGQSGAVRRGARSRRRRSTRRLLERGSSGAACKPFPMARPRRRAPAGCRAPCCSAG
jgi:octopine/nopaline transport system substrate-binding protein